MKESFVFRVWMATDGVWLAGALCVYLILYIHLDMFCLLFSLFLSTVIFCDFVSTTITTITTNEIEGAPTRCFGCRANPSDDEDWGTHADVFVTAHSVVIEIGFDGVVVYSFVTATTTTTTGAAATAGATTSSTLVDGVGGSGRNGSSGQRDGVESIVFHRRRRSSAVSPIRT
jgi:hypothetical protein